MTLTPYSDLHYIQLSSRAVRVVSVPQHEAGNSVRSAIIRILTAQDCSWYRTLHHYPEHTRHLFSILV